MFSLKLQLLETSSYLRNENGSTFLVLYILSRFQSLIFSRDCHLENVYLEKSPNKIYSSFMSYFLMMEPNF